MVTFARRRDEWLDEHAAEWVRAGLVAEAEADAIVEYERRTEPDGSALLSVGAEVAAYLGSVLALMGGAFVIDRRWDELGLAGHLGVAAAVALVGFAAGSWLARLDDVGTTRLGRFLWAVGSGGVAMFVAVAVDRVVDDRGWVLLAAGVAVLAVGLALWRNLERPLQLLTAVVGFVLVLAGIGGLVRIPSWVGSTVLMVVGGLVALFAGLDRLAPRTLATAVGAVGAFVGAMAFGDVNEHVGPLAALAVAALLVVHALVTGRVPLLVVGVIGTLIATQAALMTTFDGAMASMIVALLGLAVVVIAVLVSVRPGRRRDTI